jgi:hypothetical protein
VELEELRELLLIGAETMEGWEGCGEREGKRRKCVDFSPNRCGKNLISQEVGNEYVGKIFGFSDIILTDTFALCCSLLVYSMC